MFIQTHVVVVFTALVIGMIIWLIILSAKISAINEKLTWHWTEILDVSHKFRQYKRKHKKQLDEEELRTVRIKLSELSRKFGWSDNVVDDIMAVIKGEV